MTRRLTSPVHCTCEGGQEEGKVEGREGRRERRKKGEEEGGKEGGREGGGEEGYTGIEHEGSAGLGDEEEGEDGCPPAQTHGACHVTHTYPAASTYTYSAGREHVQRGHRQAEEVERSRKLAEGRRRLFPGSSVSTTIGMSAIDVKNFA